MANLARFAQGFRGLNRAAAPALLAPGESPDTTDAAPYNKLNGTLGPRKGRRRAYTHTASTNILGLGTFAIPSGRFHVYASSDGKWSAKGQAWPGLNTPADLSDLTGMNTSARVRSLQYKERLYGFNGRDAMRCLDGQNWTKAGIAKITTAALGTYTPTATLGGTGLTGTYRYFVTACNSKKLNLLGRAVESLPSEISAAVTPANQTVTVNNIPATQADSQVDSFNIYRNKTGAYSAALRSDEQDFYYVGSVPYGTTTYADSTSDDTLTSRPKLRFGQQTPACFKHGCIANDRMFGVGFDPIVTGTVTRLKTISTVLVNGANVATIVTTTAHGFTTGQVVTMSGMTGADTIYNIGPVTLTVTTTTAFTVPLTHAIDGVHTPAGTGIADSPSAYIDFTTALPDGAIGAWFQKKGEAALYRITALVTTRATIAGLTLAGATDVGFVGAAGSLSGASYAVFRKPWEIYISQFEDVEAAGLDGEAYRYKKDLPGHLAATAIAAFQGQVLVFTENDIFQVTGSGPNIDDIGVRLLYHGIGCVSGDAIVQVDNELHFLSKRGPALLAGGEPQLYGLPLNTDYLDSLTEDELALACMGTNDDYVWVSVPVHGQTENSKTYRYERYTQTWWEETEMCPRFFVRSDDANGVINVLYYAQGRFIIEPNYSTLDIVSASVSGGAYYDQIGSGQGITNFLPQREFYSTQLTSNVATITTTYAHGFSVGDSINVNASDSNYNGTFTIVAVPSTTSFTYALVHADITIAIYSADPTYGINLENQFTTSSGALQQCYVRFYRGGRLYATRRITSNTIYGITWSNDSSPGTGTVSVLAGDTWEIGNVRWVWETRHYDGDEPAAEKKNQEVIAIFNTYSSTADLTKQDVVDEVKQVDSNSLPVQLTVYASQLVTKFAGASLSNFTYGARLSSRAGAVLRGLEIEADVI